MQKFSVRVRTEAQSYEYAALVRCSIDAVEAATERFGLCGVTVVPMPEQNIPPDRPV